MSSTPDSISFMGMSSSPSLSCLPHPAYTQGHIEEGGRGGRLARFLIATNKHTSPWERTAAPNRGKIMHNTCWWQSRRFPASIIRPAIQKEKKKKGARSVAASRHEPAQVVLAATEFFRGGILILSLSSPSRASRSPAKSRVSPYGRPHSKRRATTQGKEKSTSS